MLEKKGDAIHDQYGKTEFNKEWFGSYSAK